jgi:hypothetical protein
MDVPKRTDAQTVVDTDCAEQVDDDFGPLFF